MRIPTNASAWGRRLAASNPPKYDRPFRIDDDHTYIGRDMVHCRRANDSESHGYDSEGDVTCRLCGARLPVRHVRAQNPTISPMLRAAVYARKGMRTGRAVARAFGDLRRQATMVRQAWRGPSKNPGSILDTILYGDRVTIVNRFGQKHTGKAVMRGPAGWVLDMGGRHGTPGIATEQNIVKVRRSPTHRAQGMLAQDYADKLTQQIEQKRRQENPARSVMGEAQGTPYFAENPPPLGRQAQRMLEFLIVHAGWHSVASHANKYAVQLERRGLVQIARHPHPSTWQVRCILPKVNPPHGANAPVQIYGRTEKIFMQKTDGPYKGQKFVHSFRPGVRQIGLPARTVIQTPDGNTAAIPKRAVLLQGKGDLWRNFQA